MREDVLEPTYANIHVELIDHMGDDRTVVNAARVSMAKHHEKFTQGDRELIKYLAANNHWSPFAHPQVSLRIRAPIFVARQLAKHQVGLAWNEVSRRYVDDDPTFYEPEARVRAENVKQGSGKAIVNGADSIVRVATRVSFAAYKTLLSMDVAPEVARAVLPQNMMTEWIWTGSLYAFARVVQLRCDPHAQKESQIVGKMIRRILLGLFPRSTEALIKKVEKSVDK